MAIDPIDPRPLASSVPVKHWANKYVGIRYRDKGDGFEGCSCWGLIRLVFANELGIELSAHGDISASDLVKAAKRMAEECSTGPWISVIGPPREFDVVKMYAMTDGPRRRRIEGHVGVMTSATKLLHVWEVTDAVNMVTDHPMVRAKIISFHRHKKIAS